MRDLNQYKQLHNEDASYGATGLGYLVEIEQLIKHLKFSKMIFINNLFYFMKQTTVISTFGVPS